MSYQNSATVEHLIPRSLGGPTQAWNLAAACYRCNTERGVECSEVFAGRARHFLPDARTIEDAKDASKRQKAEENLRRHREHNARHAAEAKERDRKSVV